MSLSAAALGGLGLAATFLPQEIVAWAGGGGRPAVLLVQIVGGLYLGFAMLNWSVRDMAIGGIYNRPIAMGNLLHFTSVGLALVRGIVAGERQAELVALTCLYGLFAVWFGVVLFRSPTRVG
ncbi:MAG: hypothetical protein ABI689_08765 [Thermoanaerobaculia bacterium]